MELARVYPQTSIVNRHDIIQVRKRAAVNHNMPWQSIERGKQFGQSRLKKMDGPRNDEQINAGGGGELVRKYQALLALTPRKVLHRLALEWEIVDSPDDLGGEMQVSIELKEEIPNAPTEVEGRAQFGRERRKKKQHWIVALPRDFGELSVQV